MRSLSSSSPVGQVADLPKSGQVSDLPHGRLAQPTSLCRFGRARNVFAHALLAADITSRYRSSRISAPPTATSRLCQLKPVSSQPKMGLQINPPISAPMMPITAVTASPKPPVWPGSCPA